MSNAKNIVFDFDGTIADTIDLSFRIYNRIAPEYNCLPVSKEVLELLKERKPAELLKEYGISHLKLLWLVLRMRKELSNHLPEVKPVTGMEASLMAIKNAGFRLGILTSNSKENVSRFLKNNNLSGLFEFIYSGKSYFGKEAVIRRMLLQENIPAASVIYVGDETRDIEASKKAGISVIAVTWGFNTKEMLASFLPDQIAVHPGELPQHIRNICHER